jgi:Flp pilus assembly pilin Flp
LSITTAPVPPIGHDGSMRASGESQGEAGASAVEYALLVAGIALGAIVVIVAFVRVATSAYDSTCEHVGREGVATAPEACG